MAIASSRTVSAGLLLFRRAGAGGVEVLLAHPGGPFFRNKDEGFWTIPKGAPLPGEDLAAAARREFDEELGLADVGIEGELLELGEVRQKGGKTVHGFALEGDLPPSFAIDSNTFEVEWPPRSGRYQMFPEVDRAEFFPIAAAREKINSAQAAFLDRLLTALDDLA
jgi:predicted NUDIX family NTP pyrophosphohydrolase